MVFKLTKLNKQIKPKQDKLPINAPTIDEVYSAFKKYETAVLDVMRTSPKCWEGYVNNRKDILRIELKNMGLADLIRWD